MISYDPLWNTMRKHGLNKEALTKVYGISKGTINSINHNRGINTHTINLLCTIFSCTVNDIIEYRPGVEDVLELEARMKERK